MHSAWRGRLFFDLIRPVALSRVADRRGGGLRGDELPGAAAHAGIAYGKVLAAAAQVGVSVEPQAWQSDYKAKSRNAKFVDTVDYHRNRP